MYYIQFDEICKMHGFEIEHDAHGDGVTLKYPAGHTPKESFRLSQNHLSEEVSAMAEKYRSDSFAMFIFRAAAAAGNTISLSETMEENKKVSAALSDLADDLKQAELEAKTWVCTDPDTCQWRRQVGGTRYELYDIFEAPNGTFLLFTVKLTRPSLTQMTTTNCLRLIPACWTLPTVRANAGHSLRKHSLRPKNFPWSVNAFRLSKELKERFGKRLVQTLQIRML